MDFIDAMRVLDNGGRVTRKEWKNSYWEKMDTYVNPFAAPEVVKQLQEEFAGRYREKYTGPAACAGSTLFEYSNIDDDQKEAKDWEVYVD